MNRRGFLGAMFAAAAAPAIVRASSLMKAAPLVHVPSAEEMVALRRYIRDPALVNPLFTGEIGQINGMRWHMESSVIARREFSKSLFESTQRIRIVSPSALADLMGRANG